LLRETGFLSSLTVAQWSFISRFSSMCFAMSTEKWTYNAGRYYWQSRPELEPLGHDVRGSLSRLAATQLSCSWWLWEILRCREA